MRKKSDFSKNASLLFYCWENKFIDDNLEENLKNKIKKKSNNDYRMVSKINF